MQQTNIIFILLFYYLIGSMFKIRFLNTYSFCLKLDKQIKIKKLSKQINEKKRKSHFIALGKVKLDFLLLMFTMHLKIFSYEFEKKKI